MAELTMRLELQFAPETLAVLRDLGAKIDLLAPRLTGAASAPVPMEPKAMVAALDRINAATVKRAAEGSTTIRACDEFGPQPVPVAPMKPVSGVGERPDAVGDGVHQPRSSPSPSVSSLNSPGADVLPASFSPPGRHAGRSGIVWTEDRDMALAVYRSAGQKFPEIFAQLQAMQGEAITNQNAVEKRWYRLKYTGQVAGLLAKAQEISEAAKKVQPPARVRPDASPDAVWMSVSEARQWAATRGLCNGQGAALDMKAVNAKRAALGLPKIMLEKCP